MGKVKNDIRTPLAKAMGLGSAKDGTEHFWRQRITALINIPIFIIFLLLIILHVGKGYQDVHHLFSNPFFAILALVMLISGLYHMKLGIQVIIEDYCHSHKLKAFLLSLNVFACYVEILACIVAVLKINFGG